MIDLLGRTHLLGDAAVHHDHSVCKRHGFDLVVRDVEARRLEALMELLDLKARLHAKLRVEVRERFVEEEDRGFAHDGAAHRDALALTARELTGTALEKVPEFEHLRRLFDAAADFLLRNAADLEAVRHVVKDRHVRIERVVLKDHRAVAVLGFEVVDDPVADREFPGGDRFEPRDHAQKGRLAAARGADDHDEFAVLDVERDAVDDLDVAVALLDVLERNACHFIFPYPRDP